MGGFQEAPRGGRIALAAVPAYLDTHIPQDIAEQHRGKFREDVLTGLQQLDVARIAGLGITRGELQAWLQSARDLPT